MTTWPSVMVTGHRPQHLDPDVRPWVRAELDRLAVKLSADHGMTLGISGMALGADQWWAAALVRHKIDLEAHIPFPQQANRWQSEDVDEWNRLLRVAHKLVTYGGFYDVKFLHARNLGMLRRADLVIAVWDPAKTTGGTASAVEKATKMRLPIIHVNPVAQTTTIRRPAQNAA